MLSLALRVAARPVSPTSAPGRRPFLSLTRTWKCSRARRRTVLEFSWLCRPSVGARYARLSLKNETGITTAMRAPVFCRMQAPQKQLRCMRPARANLVRTRLKTWMRHGSFLRNVSVLTGGTLLAHAVIVLAMPVLTRLYNPSDFALFAVYAAILSIATVVSCLRYNIAIPLPEDHADGMALLAASLLSALAICAICALPVVLAPDATAALLGQPALKPYLWMLPLGILLAATYEALQYWASRKKRFAIITQTRIVRAVGASGVQLGIGALQPSPFGLIFGHMIYGGLGSIGLTRNLVREDRESLRLLTRHRIVAQARRHWRFPVYSAPEALLNTAGVELPLILIAMLAAEPEAGFLLLAMRVMSMPMALIGSSVAQVYLAEAPQKQKDGTLSAFTKSTMWTLLKASTTVLVVIGIASPFAFPLLFGQEWERSGWLMAWMTPWSILQFVVSPVSTALYILGQYGVAILLQLFGFLIRIGAIVVAGMIAPQRMAEAFALSSALFYAVYLLLVFRH